MSECKRGYVPKDEKEFNQESQVRLRQAQQDIHYLLERGYSMKGSSTFVGNHYMLSERQRLAIVRATTQKSILAMRKEKQKNKDNIGKKVAIDGLNVIITLEVALSDSTLIRCMDGTIRDLAGLRGTYRIIDKTDMAIQLIGKKLSELQIHEVVFYLDAPVSNTGRLKLKIIELLEGYPFTVSVEIVNSPDTVLEKSSDVITGDGIILNKCTSWFNMVADIIEERLPDAVYVDLSMK